MTTIHRLLQSGAENFGPRPAILLDELTTSYADLLARAEATAAGFSALGITERDHVAIVMDNSFENVLAWLGSSIIGCTEVPINPQYRGQLLLYLLRDAEVTIIICDEAYLEQVREVAFELPSLRLVIVKGAGTSHASSNGVPMIDFSECMRGRGGIDAATDAPERVILYTSGTTGPSKGVVHTQKSCLELAKYNARTLEYDQTDRLLNFFPLYHQNARYTGVIPALVVGASVRVERRFSASAFWNICDRDGTTAFNYLGSVLRLILNATPPSRSAGKHSVKKAFGAGAAPQVWSECEERLGIRLVETYGLSEAPMATINVRLREGGSPVGSAGKAGELFEVAVVDDDDRMVATGEVGEIVMRPRRPDVIMSGYYNKDAATVRAFRNLWFHSGDRGRLTAEGDLYFEERGKDSIRRRGENVSAWEVESILDQHPDVAESAVYGIASAEVDEEVAAAIVLRRANADLADILRHARERLPGYAVPTLIRVMSDLPRTPTLKVQKAELRAAGRSGCVLAAELTASARSA